MGQQTTFFKERNKQVWEVTMTCDCERCSTFIETAIVECLVFGDRRFQQIEIISDDHRGLVTVENWSR